jgi:hypothetical protein
VVDTVTGELVGIHLAEIYHDVHDGQVAMPAGPRNVDDGDVKEQDRDRGGSDSSSGASNSGAEDVSPPRKKRKVTATVDRATARASLAFFFTSAAVVQRFGRRRLQALGSLL